MDHEGRTFLLRSALFLLPLLLLFVYTESFLRNIPSTYGIKKSALERQLKDIEVLALGASHTFFGVDPALFSRKGFNLADQSQSFFYDNALVKKYAKEMPQLRCVLLDASYFSLGYELHDSPEVWRDYFYYNIWGVRHPELTLDSRAYSYLMLYTLQSALGYLLHGAPSWSELDETGWYRVDVGSPVTTVRGKERVAYHSGLIREENYAKNMEYLREMLSMLKGRGVGVGIVSPPTNEAYYQFLDPSVERKNEALFGGLCQAYGCLRFDYSRDGRFTALELFRDNDHLNALGAEKFSTILDKEVLPKICHE